MNNGAQSDHSKCWDVDFIYFGGERPVVTTIDTLKGKLHWSSDRYSCLYSQLVGYLVCISADILLNHSEVVAQQRQDE